MKHLRITAALAAALTFVGMETEAQRPAFDKSGFQKAVWAHANPWFPFNKQPIHDLGGPNVAYIHYTGENIWGRGLKLLDEYGLDAVQLEINEPGGWGATYQTLLREAKAVGAKIKIAMFFGCYSKTPEATLNSMKKILGQFRGELKTHPNVLRIDGRPVVVIYNPRHYKPEQWKIVFDGLDREFGPMLYLCSYRSFALDPKLGLENLRSYMTVFDGVSNYGSSGLKDQRNSAAFLERTLKKDFPQKIYDGGVHSTYTCHFHMGGLEVDLSRNYRESFEIFLETGPDSICITNLFDHYENSLIFPCYEREDFMLRYMQYRISKWRGKPFPALKTPELVVTNHIQILLGRQDLDFEVMGFPIDADRKEVLVQLELCNTSGEVLNKFPPKKMILDDFRVERFSVPSVNYANERGIVPRLTYTWNGKTYKMNYNPMTQISPSIRSYRMYWARSTKNALLTDGPDHWTMNDAGPGETVIASDSGISIFAGGKKPVWNRGDRSGYLRHGIKRDGLEFYFIQNSRSHLAAELALSTPRPGQALHWYYLEMENRHGRKWQSLPIWETDGSRAKKVTVPIRLKDGTIRDFRIEGARVPFFYYPCDEDGRKLLLDVSGCMHHGCINGSGYGGGHLGYTGYNYYHNGPVAIKDVIKQFSIFGRDPDGRGFLRFSGKNHITIMGSTAFPGASTYELSVRPAELGSVMGLLGSGNNQIALKILPDGRVQAARRAETEGMGGSTPKKQFDNKIESTTKLEAGKWTRIAVVYDCRKLRLYLDGKLEGEIDSAPVPGHDWINHLLVGASNKWVWDPIERFKGDLRDIRIYGRNLAPEEFLTDRPVPKKVNPYERKKVVETLLNTGTSEFSVLKAENGELVLTKRLPVLSKKSFRIEPGTEYLFTLKLKNRGAKSFPVYVGAAISGVSPRQVYFHAGTETELLADMKKGDKVLYVKSISGWKPGGSAAFNADPSGSDLPNRMLAQVDSVAEENGKGKITLKQGAPCEAKAGSPVREHREGPPFNWAGSVYAAAGKEVTFTARMKGVASFAPEEGKFWPGARQFAFVLAPIGAVSENSPLTFSEIKLEAISMKESE